MTLCRRGEDWKHRHLAAEEVRVGADMAFKAYGHPLKMVSSLKYLERMLSALDKNWPEWVANLRTARNK